MPNNETHGNTRNSFEITQKLNELNRLRNFALSNDDLESADSLETEWKRLYSQNANILGKSAVNALSTLSGGTTKNFGKAGTHILKKSYKDILDWAFPQDSTENDTSKSLSR